MNNQDRLKKGLFGNSCGIDEMSSVFWTGRPGEKKAGELDNWWAVLGDLEKRKPSKRQRDELCARLAWWRDPLRGLWRLPPLDVSPLKAPFHESRFVRSGYDLWTSFYYELLGRADNEGYSWPRKKPLNELSPAELRAWKRDNFIDWNATYRISDPEPQTWISGPKFLRLAVNAEANIDDIIDGVKEEVELWRGQMEIQKMNWRKPDWELLEAYDQREILGKTMSGALRKKWDRARNRLLPKLKAHVTSFGA